MASIADGTAGKPQKSLAPDRLERVLGALALMLLAAMIIAIAKGRAEWGEVPLAVWGHLATIATALVLTPVMLWRKRGDRFHRQLGWIWTGAMALTAAISFDIRLINQGGFSWIHLLSAWTLIQVPVIIWSARTHNVVRHRSSVRGMIIGALIIAGLFTFPFNRLMGHWLFG